MDDNATAQSTFLFSIFAVVMLLVAVGVVELVTTYLSINKSTQQNLQDWAKRKKGHYYWPISFWGMFFPLRALRQIVLPSWPMERIAGLSLGEQATAPNGCLEIFIQERQIVILQTSAGEDVPLFWYAKIDLGIPPISHFLISPHGETVLGIMQYYALGWGTLTTEDATFNQKMRVQGRPEYMIYEYLTAKRRAVLLELVSQYPSFYIDRGYACIQVPPGTEGDPIEQLIMGTQDICLNYPSIFVT